MAQSWPWDSQIAVKKKQNKKKTNIKTQMFEYFRQFCFLNVDSCLHGNAFSEDSQNTDTGWVVI